MNEWSFLLRNSTLPKFKNVMYVNKSFFEKYSKFHSRLVVSIAVIDKSRKLLLIRNRKRGTLELIGGKVEKGENALSAAERELKEEIGIDRNSLLRLYHAAVYRNIFIHNSQSFEHLGIFFVALVRNLEDVKITPNSKEVEDFEIVKIGKRLEIAEFNKGQLDILPKVLSFTYVRTKSSPLRRILKALLPPNNKLYSEIGKIVNRISPINFLDVNAGFNNKVKVGNYFVNDLDLNASLWHNDAIAFNFDVRELPFKKVFDLAYSKALLHHLDEKGKIEAVRKMLEIGKNVLICDVIENSSIGFKVFRKIYKTVEDEHEEYFIHSKEELEDLILRATKNAVIVESKAVNTYKGSYALVLATS